jgi:hypothetical protein
LAVNGIFGNRPNQIAIARARQEEQLDLSVNAGEPI